MISKNPSGNILSANPYNDLYMMSITNEESGQSLSFALDIVQANSLRQSLNASLGLMRAAKNLANTAAAEAALIAAETKPEGGANL